MKKNLLLVTGLTVLILSGCDRYPVTLNDRELYRPAALFSDYQLLDISLKACVQQTINDQKIVRAEQLTVLVCTYAGIETLTGLGRFTQLETINLANNSLGNIKPLLFFGQLKQVDLTGNPDLDCKDVESLEELLPIKPTTGEKCLD
ncbi:MAG: leucine-rich repeat domain-containing protein [Porticoccaceae bacterium]|jgi:hypothetical protein|nr:leucine-rich repeat domain-containing protein [Porticoccaceae bacterium]MDG1311028.1 leucine-rich repeat domain-containing protein [Porticoccaceae bacterium]